MGGGDMEPEGTDVAEALARVRPDWRSADAARLDALFREVTGWRPRLWAGAVLGYGRYRYRYASGREGAYLATGFAARARAFSIHIMPGYADFSGILARLGPHRAGKSCVHVTRLSEIDEGVLAELIRAGLRNLERHWPVEPT